MKKPSMSCESLQILKLIQQSNLVGAIKFLLIATAFVFLFSCNDNKEGRKKDAAHLPSKPIEKLYGNWLCSNLIDSIEARKSMVSIFDTLTLPYAYEMQFDASFNDSVLIYNGFEQFFLPLIINGDSVILNNAIQGDPIILHYDSMSSTLKLMISKHENYPLTTVFFKANEKYIQSNGRFKEAFVSAFNEATISGNYSLIHKNRFAQGANFSFEVDGKLNGYEGGLRYNCCIGGDCLGMMRHPINILSISMENKSEEYWGWRLSVDSDTLTMIKLKDSNSDEPGNFVTTKEVLVLIRNH